MPPATLAPPATSAHVAGFASPLKLCSWIDEHRHLLKPPVGNRLIFTSRDGGVGDLIVQVIAGPITRKDYHVNPTEELYFQLEGDLVLRCIDRQGRVHDVAIKQGEMFMLPPGTPHAEIRPAGAVGLVIERRRPEGEDDHLRFYCDKCGSVVYDEQFEADDLAEQVRDMLERFWSDATLRTCIQCGLVIQHGGGPAIPPVAQTPSPASPVKKTAAAAGRNITAVRPSRAAANPVPVPPSRSPLAHAKKRAVVRGR